MQMESQNLTVVTEFILRGITDRPELQVPLFGLFFMIYLISLFGNLGMIILTIVRKYGLGAAILKDGELVSGASSYTSYRGGIEIQIDTREDYRRQGLAYICGAKLILECLERGWYPSWDAQNPGSAALAQKLGYHLDHEYTAYEVYR